MVKRILKILSWLLLLTFMGFTVGFTIHEIQQVKCGAVVTHIVDGSPRFLTEDDILELVTEINDSLKGQSLRKIDTNTLEAKLREVATIKNAEVYSRINGKSLEFNGKIVVNVEQRNPILRIKTGNEDFYLDEYGVKIPVSEKFTAKVLVVTGTNPGEENQKELLKFCYYIYHHPFWKAQFKQIDLNNRGELTIVPLVGDQLIEMGTTEDFKIKLRNLEAVYQQGFTKTGWDKYKTINLKYKNQVVCTKN